MKNISSWLANCNRLRVPSKQGFSVWRQYAALLKYIHIKNWSGACHASCTVLYALLKTEGLEPELCLGEVGHGQLAFDHSWIELENEVYDPAISNTLLDTIYFPPVFRGYDLETAEKSALLYGITTGQGYDPSANWIRQQSVRDYMDAFPDHPKGLLGIAKEVAMSAGISVTATALTNAVREATWHERA